MGGVRPVEQALLELERDLYRRLLELGDEQDLAPFLQQALALVVELVAAERGYIELYAGSDRRHPQFWLARGMSDGELEQVRREISTGIVKQAIDEGRIVSTASALEDPRFAEQRSVKAQRIQAVLCVPVGAPPLGVVYLQGRAATGPFGVDDCALAEIFARCLAPLVGRLVALEQDRRGEDHTSGLRSRLRVDGIAGTSRALAELFKQMLVAAPVPMSVLITGESGTGKTAVARAIHASSPRAARPFIELNCAAIPEALFESELFGAEKGAHSTATRRIEGKVDAANGGTLLLDEIGEMPFPLQSKLLGFLQSKRYMRLGGKGQIDADVRIIAATNSDLPALVAARRFREDLYYRLSVLELGVPPLRERREDIGPIADHLAQAIGTAHGAALPLARTTRIVMIEAEWPGNVRQLENAVQRGWATAVAERAPLIEPKHVFPERAVAALLPEQATFQDATRAFQARFLREELEKAGWNVSEAARRLDMSRSHLNDLIRALGLARAPQPRDG